MASRVDSALPTNSPAFAELVAAAEGSAVVQRLLALQRMVDTGEVDLSDPAPPSSRTVLQRAWEEDSDIDGTEIWRDDQAEGFTWYHDNGKLFYKTTPALDKKVRSWNAEQNTSAQWRSHLEQIKNYANTPHTYEEWRAFGWLRGEALPSQPDQAEPLAGDQPKDYSGPTSGIEVENPADFMLQLGNPLMRGVIAEVIVTASGEVLADITTDMGQNPYTIENRTRPVVMADAEGMQQRRDALALAKKGIEAAGANGGAIQPVAEGALSLVVRQADHSVVQPAKTKNPGVQVTLGASFSDLVADAPLLQGILKEAGGRWMSRYGIYNALYLANYPQPGRGAAEVFGMMGSLLHFYMDRIDNSVRKRALERRLDFDTLGSGGSGGKGVEGGELVNRPELVDPKEKNAWGLLPKTPPAKWLEGIAEEDARKVKALLAAPGDVNRVAWDTIKLEILRGDNIAGHAAPEFTIGGEKAFAFEIRSPTKEDRQPYDV
jgi:hypothetical protein